MNHSNTINATAHDETTEPQPRLSIVIPCLNEAKTITKTLRALQGLRERGVELVLVDGGSVDDTVQRARPWVDILVSAPRGRALQMNLGGAYANAEVLLFLHADTHLPAHADRLILEALSPSSTALWGRFDVTIEGRSPMLRVVAALMNLRSRVTGIATGDQGIFIRRQTFKQLGGFPIQPLMEDIELSTKLCRQARPICLRARVTTSGRRWDERGVWRTITLMWWLRWRYWRGEAPERLAKDYR